MGRIVNYLLDTLEVSRTINNGINSTVAKLKIGKSYRDPFAVQVAEGDSVRLSYSIGLPMVTLMAKNEVFLFARKDLNNIREILKYSMIPILMN
ncbi:hypothetical protein KUH03_29590 [Sphingobacterium sp. E70]|uniref:hypothetical protein n=1 Tax=Sphingobacterium sp. E70 TaxID=2853439 RepID=UPI00211C187D|nr:hypothetical protein [Sphingobacterium sp. E70]ULT23327.1 hypothetical protein KUH03_29590 [Sphingobacterium sp. E70]